MILLTGKKLRYILECVDLQTKRRNYQGWSETDLGSFFTIDKIKSAYDLFNKKFFNSKLPNTEFRKEPHPKVPSAFGFTRYQYILTNPNDSFDRYDKLEDIPENAGISKLRYISICPHIWYSRGHMEEVLLHEMCHVYQTQVLLNSDLNKCLKVRKRNNGHETLFVKVLDMVNNSSVNTEGFLVRAMASPSDYYQC